MKYDYLLKWKFKWVAGNRHLSSAESENNAAIVAQMFLDMNMSMNACAAILGNMQGESGINPAIWENLGNPVPRGEDENGDTIYATGEELGYGLVQWTPGSKYLDWARALGAENNYNYEPYRIFYEMENNMQWIPTTAYPITFSDFWKSNLPVNYLTYAFMHNYERPADLNHPDRIQYAEYYLNSIVKRTMRTGIRNLLIAYKRRKKFLCR